MRRNLATNDELNPSIIRCRAARRSSPSFPRHGVARTVASSFDYCPSVGPVRRLDLDGVGNMYLRSAAGSRQRYDVRCRLGRSASSAGQVVLGISLNFEARVSE